ncbi:Ig-like domain-containing protein [Methanobrevibacter thaueri]|nr:hypothetical protein [Methanobrevibacter thaueri]
MNFKIIFGLILVCFIITSMSIVTAEDMDNNTNISKQSDEVNLNEINDKNSLEVTQDTVILAEEDSHVIYVGQNKTADGGNGTSNNPFESFELASKNVSGEKKVEINVYNGTYYLDSDLKFNTSNLIINGIGQVVIKNLQNKDGAYASFGLSFSSGNFTFSNLIFDGSNCSSFSSVSINKPLFHVFKGTAELGILYNCTFTGFNNVNMFSNQFNRKFIRCNFIDTYNYICLDNWYDAQIVDFEYCIISQEIYIGRMPLNNARLNITFNNVWFGTNKIDNYLHYEASSNLIPVQVSSNVIRYAIFSASENYLGNNTYEIIGKLVWNDTTTEGIELLNPMIVKISSRTGNAPKTVILENGTFRIIYNSTYQDNTVEIELDSQEVILEFKNGIQAIANPIYVGDEQIITVILPQAINGIVNITVSNITYEVPSNGLSKFNFTVPDELLEGNYQVDVKIIDNKNHIYGFNTTNWTISKINKNIVVISPADAYIDDESINITVLMEKDASGNITVFVGDKNITKECFGRNIQIDISSLITAGENKVTVAYSGNKRYLSQIKEENIFVNRVYPNITIQKPTNIFIGDEVNIAITLPHGAIGNITLCIGEKNFTINNISNENIINISKYLVSGFNPLTVKYSGDDFWDSQSVKEMIYVSKLIPAMSVKIISQNAVIRENITIQITLPQDASGNISLEIGKNNYSTDIFNEHTIINVTSTISGINSINVTYNGNDKYSQQSTITNIKVEKLNISLNEVKISITNHTTPCFSINLPQGISGNVTVMINGKSYVATLINGTASLKIQDLMPNNYQATVSYESDIFNPIYCKVNFTVPKPQLNANNVNMIYTSGSKYTVHVSASGSPVVGKEISFTINGKKTTAKTNNKGYASVKIDLPPKSTKYLVTANYQGVKIINTIKVNSLIKVKNIKVKKSSKTFKIKVVLKKINKKYLKGKKITLKFKGKKYTVKTNKKGVATFKLSKNVVKKLMIGKKYNYRVNYLKDSAVKKVIVKK